MKFTEAEKLALETLVPTIVAANASKGVRVTREEVREMFDKGLLEIVFQEDGTAGYWPSPIANKIIAVLGSGRQEEW